MKKIGILLVIILILSLSLTVFACDNNNSNGTTNDDNDNNQNNNVTDGFISGKATIEELSEDLVKSLLNTAKTASTSRLNSTNNPCVSWHIMMDTTINGQVYSCVFEINYDHRDKSKTEMKLLVVRKGEVDPFVSLYYFQDEPQNEKCPGNLYFQYGDAKVKVPVTDTFLGQLFPISFNGVEDKVVIGFISANIFTKGDILYKYKDGTDGKRTRNYVFQVDMKATLVNIVNMMNGGTGFDGMSESINWIIESLFGVESGKINTQLPDTTITIDVTTSGGSRNSLGTGAISNFKLRASVAASDYKDSIFRGESYNIGIELVEFKASSKLIEDFPKEDSSVFESYLSYSETALIINGALVYLDDEENLYDITIGFRYDGLAESQNQDEVMIVVTEKDNPTKKVVEFYAFGNEALFNFHCPTAGEWVETSFPFDIDYFIEYVMDIASVGDSFGFLKTVAYSLGSIQVWEDGSLSLKVNKEFYKGLLNLDIEVLVAGLKLTCSHAGGTLEQLPNEFMEHGTTLEDVLSSIVIERELLLIFDNGDDSIDTSESLIDKTIFED